MQDDGQGAAPGANAGPDLGPESAKNLLVLAGLVFAFVGVVACRECLMGCIAYGVHQGASLELLSWWPGPRPPRQGGRGGARPRRDPPDAGLALGGAGWQYGARRSAGREHGGQGSGTSKRGFNRYYVVFCMFIAGYFRSMSG